MALAEAIIEVVKDKDRARRIGAEGRRTVVRKFNLDSFLQSFERVFDKYSKCPRELADSSALLTDHGSTRRRTKDFGQF